MKKPFLLLMTIMLFLHSPVLISAHSESGVQHPPSTTSEAAVMIDAKSGTVLYDKNADKSMYPASLTKIATAIYAIENAKLDTMTTVSENARTTDGTTVYLKEGERVSLKKLIQGLLINSGNDAGVAIAEQLSGSVDAFASDLNAYLQNVIGVKNTHFENPHGLFDKSHVTTAADMARMTQYALKNETFREIFGTITLDWNGDSWDTTLLTHHKMLSGERPYEGVAGGKTGFVTQSGYTLATTAARDDISLIVITLDTNLQSQAYDDTINLLDYGFDRYKQFTIEKGTTFKTGKKTFMTPEDITYTGAINQQPRKEVSRDGLLEITDKSGDVILSSQLERHDKMDNAEAAAENTDVKENAVFGSHIPWLIIPIILVIIGTVGFIYRRRGTQ